MHQPDTRPRQSLYFDYKIFPAAPCPERHAADAPVVIVGAGPIGLVTALDLARHGVRCVLVSADQQVSHGSRALAFTRRSMEILQQVGADRAVTALGLPWRFGNSYFRGHRVFRMEIDHDEHDRFYPLINLQQQVLEQILVELIAAQPLIDLRWGHKLVAFDDDTRGVTLQIDTPNGLYQQRCGWLVACDGARSTVRQLQQLQFEGDSFEGRFVIADIRVDLPLPTERLAFFDPPWNPGNTVLMHREPFGLWRIDYRVPDQESSEEALSAASLKARIDAQLAVVGAAGAQWQMDWCSVYSARALTLSDYVHGRVLYCGDAAHLLPIFGVRGANTGLQDAQNLAWKLARVSKGIAEPALLQTYTHERVAAAREIIDEAGKSTRFMTPQTRGSRLLRDATLSLAISQPWVRPLLHWRTSRPHEYRSSILNCAQDDDRLFAGGPSTGAVLANVRLGPDVFLLDQPLTGYCLLYFARPAEVPPALRSIIERRSQAGAAIELITVGPGGDIADLDGHMWRRYAVTQSGAAYLVRPDQHVCGRWLSLSADQLDITLQSVV